MPRQNTCVHAIQVGVLLPHRPIDFSPCRLERMLSWSARVCAGNGDASVGALLPGW
jgi:hypothetical protein